MKTIAIPQKFFAKAVEPVRRTHFSCIYGTTKTSGERLLPFLFSPCKIRVYLTHIMFVNSFCSVTAFYLALTYKSKAVDTDFVFLTCGDNINPCGVNAAVTKNVRQLGNVLMTLIERAGKQMT